MRRTRWAREARHGTPRRPALRLPRPLPAAAPPTLSRCATPRIPTRRPPRTGSGRSERLGLSTRPPARLRLQWRRRSSGPLDPLGTAGTWLSRRCAPTAPRRTAIQPTGRRPAATPAGRLMPGPRRPRPQRRRRLRTGAKGPAATSSAPTPTTRAAAGSRSSRTRQRPGTATGPATPAGPSATPASPSTPREAPCSGPAAFSQAPPWLLPPLPTLTTTQPRRASRGRRGTPRWFPCSRCACGRRWRWTRRWRTHKTT
mmetsp:Transcript_9152/g.21353  ORF Transcript_9152/g.21353 Transcript_9152/m.21353 type:complete len:257 (+) Transcript_9152:606-1376(+)